MVSTTFNDATNSESPVGQSGQCPRDPTLVQALLEPGCPGTQPSTRESLGTRRWEQQHPSHRKPRHRPHPAAVLSPSHGVLGVSSPPGPQNSVCHPPGVPGENCLARTMEKHGAMAALERMRRQRGGQGGEEPSRTGGSLLARGWAATGPPHLLPSHQAPATQSSLTQEKAHGVRPQQCLLGAQQVPSPLSAEPGARLERHHLPHQRWRLTPARQWWEGLLHLTGQPWLTAGAPAAPLDVSGQGTLQGAPPKGPSTQRGPQPAGPPVAPAAGAVSPSSGSSGCPPSSVSERLTSHFRPLEKGSWWQACPRPLLLGAASLCLKLSVGGRL